MFELSVTTIIIYNFWNQILVDSMESIGIKIQWLNYLQILFNPTSLVEFQNQIVFNDVAFKFRRLKIQNVLPSPT